MNKRQTSSVNQYIRFSGIAFQMGIVIAAGIYLGVWLDEKYTNTYSLFTVICSLLSVFISLFLVIRQVHKIDKRNNNYKQ
ncbi:AtpZ/AtpI family protein [Myroides indicus]|uniref:Putative F0F1-ATPase subunit (Ca2+/Mg2+ transporter) n=1 Tax=Myroides indicus TaxID=1323422 RepID=A0A4V3E8G3_9FLAO|nr:AtpZ/AtpI family protein [Myroides indicus]TDS57917.1 putative F0F1-ATPase subunit (Ca2+/Mg2+ transporter) [Myroides indicus]